MNDIAAVVYCGDFFRSDAWTNALIEHRPILISFFYSVLQFADAQSEELSRSAMSYDILWVVGASLASDSVRERYCIDDPVDDVEKCECCREDTA